MTKNEGLDAVGLVRKIRDDIYEQTREMSAQELIEYFRRHGSSIEERLGYPVRGSAAARSTS